MRGVREAVELLEHGSDRVVADALADFYPDLAVQIPRRLPESKRRQVFALLPNEKRQQWNLNVDYPEESVGRLMDPPLPKRGRRPSRGGRRRPRLRARRPC